MKEERHGRKRALPASNSQQLAPPTGMPAISVPMGFTDGMLPAGITMFLQRADPIELAFLYEQATKHRQPPGDFGSLAFEQGLAYLFRFTIQSTFSHFAKSTGCRA